VAHFDINPVTRTVFEILSLNYFGVMTWLFRVKRRHRSRDH